MISSFFIRRPIFSSVISIVIVIAGLAAIRTLPVAQYPEIVPPTVQVTAVYPGATAESLVQTVAAPLEEQINGVEGMLYLGSTSSSNGVVQITVTFEIGADIELAATEVANRVRIAEPQLPEEVRRNGVTVQKRSLDFLQILAFDSPDGRYDTLFLSNYVSINVVDSIKRVAGVGDVLLFGAREYSMRVWMRPDRMAELGVTTGDIAGAIREQNAQFAVGRIGQEPTEGPNQLTYVVKTRGRLLEPDEFEQIILRAEPDGSLLRLSDVARVELGAREYDAQSRLNGSPVVNMAVFLQPGANALETADRVSAEMEQISSRFPAGMTYQTPFDTTRYVRVSIQEVLKTLAEAMVLVFLVVFLFLQSFRATVIPILAVPVSLIGTFAGMSALGFSINTLTLFGLVLAIGIVVDDAILVLENVERVLRTENVTSTEAALRAMREVTGPIVASVLVLASVFVPVAFLGGLTGQLYRQFAITIAISVAISGIVALTLSPALCALMLRPGSHKTSGPFALFNRWFERMTGRYVGIVDFVLRHRRIAIVLFLGVVLGIWGMFRIVPGGLVPEEDQGYFIAAAQLPDGATFSRTLEVVEQIEAILGREEAVADVVAIVGFDFVGGGNKSSVATFFVILEPWDERTSPANSARALIGRFFGASAGIKEALVFAFNPPAIRGLGATGGFEVYVQNRGEFDIPRLAEQTGALIGALNQDPRLVGARTLFRADVPQLDTELDREKAKAAGIDVNAAFDALQANFGTLYVNDFNRLGRTFRVQMQAEPRFRSEPEDLNAVYVRNRRGEMVPLGAMLTTRLTTGAEIIERYNGFPAVKVLGAAAPGRSSGEAIAAVEELAASTLPADFSVDWTGSAYQEKRAGSSSVLVFALGLVFVFLILAAQYESWSLPLAVILIVPFALLGALAAVATRGLANDVFFQIGLVTLIGLGAKNAILIVEFAAQRREAGLSVREAALEAARLRLRPIIMTAMAFILGVVPLAVSTGAGAASRQSIGTGVLGGMLAATFIAAPFVPLFFALLTREPKPAPGNRDEDRLDETRPLATEET
jgi:hydrophobe/amphiphile efflux-1 (HAE1) family protein